MYCDQIYIIPTKKLERRLQKHGTGKAYAFTSFRPPLGLLYLWPESNPACEAYVYAACMAALSEDVACGGHLGGYLQTAPSYKFYEQSQEQAIREWRMLGNACLVCGSKRHLASYHERSVTTVHRPAPKQVARTEAGVSDADLYTKWYGGGNELRVNLAEHRLDEAWL